MAIDIKALEDSVQAILEPVVQAIDAAAILIIEPNNGIVPSTSYASMKTFPLSKTGFSIVGDVDDNGDIPVRAEYDITFQFSSFGPNSKNIISNLSFAITDNIIIHESLTSINLFQFDSPIITDIPVFENTNWEERNQSTISFHYAHEELVHVSLIEQVTIDGLYRDIADNIVLQTSQTINAP